MPLGRLTFIFVKINLSEKQRRTEASSLLPPIIRLNSGLPFVCLFFAGKPTNRKREK